jgi:type IV pilus assembly protein PilC
VAAFLFQAKTVEGKIVKGEVEASSENDARVKIRSQKLVLLKILPKSMSSQTSITKITKKKKNKFSLGGKVAPKELQVFTRQFATLIGSGVPIVQSLEAMIGPGRSPSLNRSLKAILDEVTKGRRLAETLKEHPQVFDNMYVNLVHAGEEGGVLDTVLTRLAMYIEKSVKLRGKIVGALFYPAAVIVVAFIIITGIMIFVIPSFVKMFRDSKMELPWLTVKVMQTSDFFLHRWYVVFAIAIAIPISLKNYYATEDGRRTLDTFMLKTPVFGDLIKKGAVARFSRTLSTMLGAGVRIVEALDIAAATTKNWVIEQVLLSAKESITKGKTLSEPLRNSHHIPHMVSQMISVGEQTGNLDQMLDKVATFYEDEVETAAGALTSMIEPVMMIVLGSIVAVIVIAMYLPIFQMAGAASNG